MKQQDVISINERLTFVLEDFGMEIEDKYTEEEFDEIFYRFLTDSKLKKYDCFLINNHLADDIPFYKNLMILFIISEFYSFVFSKIQRGSQTEKEQQIFDYLESDEVTPSDILMMFKAYPNSSFVSAILDNYFEKEKELGIVGKKKEMQLLIENNKMEQLLKIYPYAAFNYECAYNLKTDEEDLLIEEIQELNMDETRMTCKKYEDEYDDFATMLEIARYYKEEKAYELLLDFSDFSLTEKEFAETQEAVENIFYEIRRKFFVQNKDDVNLLSKKIGFILADTYGALKISSDELEDDEQEAINYLEDAKVSYQDAITRFTEDDDFAQTILKNFLFYNISSNPIDRKNREYQVKEDGYSKVLKKLNKYNNEETKNNS